MIQGKQLFSLTRMKITFNYQHYYCIIIFLLFLSLGDSSEIENSFIGKVRRRRSKICMKNQNLCGDLCYEYNYYSCQEGSRKFLCHRDELGCGDKCYHPKEASCSWGKIIRLNDNNQMVRPKPALTTYTYSSGSSVSRIRSKNNDKIKDFPGISSSNDDIFSFSSFNFNNNNNAGENSKSFDKTNVNVNNNNDNWNLICPAGQKQCGNNKCYNPNLEYCDDGNVSKFNFHTFSTISSSSLSSNNCPPGYGWCDGLCYNLMEEECFTNSKPKPKPNTDDEFSSSFYDSRTFGCGTGQLKCGKLCYDPRHEECLSRGHGQLQRCEFGQELCGEICFDPFYKKCLSTHAIGVGGSKRKIICRWNERECEGKCIDPFEQGCIIMSD